MATTEAETADSEASPGTQGVPPRRRAAIAGVAVGLALVALGGVLLLWRDDGGPEMQMTASANVPVNQDTTTLNAHNSPTIVASPTDRNTLVIADRIDRPQFGASVHVSRNGGATWSAAPLVLPPGEQRPYTPDVAFDAKGTLYVLFATMHGDSPANYPGGLWLERSGDGGSTFSAPVKVAGDFTYQPRLAVDSESGRVHVTWLQATPAVVQELAAVVKAPADKRNPGFGPGPNPIVMASSVDAGVSFSAPVQVNEAARSRVGAATPVIRPGGEVFVLYQDFGDDAADFEGKPGPVHKGRFSLVLAHSPDGGNSFSTRSVVDAGLVASERFLAYLPRFPSIAVDSKGTFYVGWSDARNGDADVFIRRSDDGGKSWSKLVRVGDEKSPRGDQYLPQVAVAPGGRVDVVYLDRRSGPNNALAVAALATSFDGGKTWQSITVSDSLFDSTVGPRNDRETPDPGSRLGLVSTANAAYPVWTDTRRGTPDTGKQDLFSAPVLFAPA